MAAWNTPARNAAISKRPCDQKTRWVFLENAPKWERYLRHGVRCAIGVRGAHCIAFSTRTDQGGALIFILKIFKPRGKFSARQRIALSGLGAGRQLIPR
jgi:hypothetical protein